MNQAKKNKTELDNLRKEFEIVKNRLQEKDDKIKTLESTVSAQKLKLQVSSLKSSNDEKELIFLRSENTKLKINLSETTKENDELQKKVKKLTAENKKELERLSVELNNKCKNLEEKEKHISELKTNNKKLEEEIVDKTTKSDIILESSKKK